LMTVGQQRMESVYRQVLSKIAADQYAWPRLSMP
jgi:hypothetical protein